MFKRILLALGFLFFAGPAFAQNVTCATRPNADSSNACASTAFVHNYTSSFTGTPTVATNTALKAVAAATYPRIIRNNFRTTSDGGYGSYYSTSSACTRNSGAGDNGVEVQAADGGCWLLDQTVTNVTPYLYGAVCDGSSHALSTYYGSLSAAKIDYPFATATTQTVDWAAWQAAVTGVTNTSAQTGGKVYFNNGICYVNSTITIPWQAKGLTIQGGGVAAQVILNGAADLFGVSAYDAGAAQTVPINAMIRDIHLSASSVTGAYGLIHFANGHGMKADNIWFGDLPSVGYAIIGEGTPGAAGNLVYSVDNLISNIYFQGHKGDAVFWFKSSWSDSILINPIATSYQATGDVNYILKTASRNNQYIGGHLSNAILNVAQIDGGSYNKFVGVIFDTSAQDTVAVASVVGPAIGNTFTSSTFQGTPAGKNAISVFKDTYTLQDTSILDPTFIPSASINAFVAENSSSIVRTKIIGGRSVDGLPTFTGGGPFILQSTSSYQQNFTNADGSNTAPDLVLDGYVSAVPAGNGGAFIGRAAAQNATWGLALPFVAPRAAIVGSIVIGVEAAPGVGQTFTYELYVNNAATGKTVTISGAAVSATLTANYAIQTLYSVALKLTTSGGAAVTAHYFNIGMSY